MNGFGETELKPPGILARLFGMKVKENAFREVQNLLAKTPISDIQPEAIESILSTYGVRPGKVQACFKHFYATALRHSCRDHDISNTEVEDLQRLRDLLGLTDHDVREVKQSVIHPIYKQELQAALKDEHLSPEEKARLDDLVRRLRIPEEVAQDIYKEDATALMQRVFDNAVSDRRLSAEEDAQLTVLAEILGVKIQHDETTAATLYRFRLYWRIEQGDLPEVSVPIHLQRKEQCYASIPDASHYEFKTVTRAYQYSGPTARIRLAKGVYWRLGQISLNRVSEEVLALKDTGTLYITNKRLLFDGAKKNSIIRLGRIINFELYKNGIQIEKDAGKDQFFECSGDMELFGVVLGAALARSRQ